MMSELEPIEGALVRILRDAEQVAEGTTDADGRARFPLAPGDYRAVVSAAGWLGREVPFTADADREITIELSPGYTITIRVVGRRQG